jgi:hypothetical protein
MAVPAMKALVASKPAAGGGGWSPTDLPDLVGWWDLSDEATVTTSTGISQVNDKSGSGNHLVQATGSNQPAHTTSASLGGGTLKVASFDGSDDLLATSATPATVPLTFLVVARKRSSGLTASNPDVLIRAAAHATYIGSGPILYFWTGSTQQNLSSTSSDWTTAGIYVCTMQTTTFSFWLNGSNKANGVGLSNNGSEALYLGSEATTNQGDWDVGEVILCASSLSNSDINAAAGYLADKWGLSWTNI